MRTLPRFFLGVFFTFAPFGLVTDMMSLGIYRPVELLAWVLLCGTVAVGYAHCSMHNRRLIPLVLLVQLAAIWPLIGAAESRPPLGHASLRARMALDAVGAISLLSVGYAFFVSFILNEGLKHLRFRTEVALAEEIHGVLVPPVAAETRGYEAYGRSFPASEVGGDLVDLVVRDGVLTGYLADVSGHGVPAGALMGMLKSAARMRLRGDGDLGQLLYDLNEVLLPLKKPNMFATCAVVRLLDGEAEYALAGHLPILHYSRETRSVSRLAKGHLPLGLLGDQAFEAGTARLEPGDILVLLSDGLTEVEDARGDEFGLERIEALVTRDAEESLVALFEGIVGAVSVHGSQTDDQTLLLIRALTAAPPLVTIFSLP
jgi:sigma-B regulation protein RsbU (phosphoserine phosphatase)